MVKTYNNEVCSEDDDGKPVELYMFNAEGRFVLLTDSNALELLMVGVEK